MPLARRVHENKGADSGRVAGRIDSAILVHNCTLTGSRSANRKNAWRNGRNRNRHDVRILTLIDDLPLGRCFTIYRIGDYSADLSGVRINERSRHSIELDLGARQNG